LVHLLVAQPFPRPGIVWVRPVSLPSFIVSTNFLNPLLNSRRSAPCRRSPARLPVRR